MMKFIFSQAVSTEDLAHANQGLESLRNRPEAGFWSAAHDESMWSQVAVRAEQIRDQADHIVVVGIGGSSLGAQALISLADGTMPFFWDNLDPETVTKNFSELTNLSRTHWLWVSKSGTTLETLIHLELASEKYRQQGLNIADHSTVIAEQKLGPLQDWANQNQIFLLPIPGNVSGRFSVFTAAGLLPAALANVNLKEIREGLLAAEKDQKNVNSLAAATLASWRREEWVTLFWTYGDRLRPLTKWLQQLWAESLAKNYTWQGQKASRVSFPVCCVGSLDQHSILQQVMEGARDKWVWLFAVQPNRDQKNQLAMKKISSLHFLNDKTLGQVFWAQAEGMARGLNEVGVSTCQWIWPKVDAKQAGFALFTLELMVAVLGECLQVNAFNQPGVERGKTITQEILRK